MKNYLPHQTPKNFTLILFENEQVVDRLETHSRNRFTNKINSLPENFTAFIRVSYKSFGANWGEYLTKEDLFCMYKAFIWEEVWGQL